jgi:hypothetical protein
MMGSRVQRNRRNELQELLGFRKPGTRCSTIIPRLAPAFDKPEIDLFQGELRRRVVRHNRIIRTRRAEIGTDRDS